MVHASMPGIEDWLTSIGLAQYAALFAANDIDRDIVGELCDQDLEKIGITSLGHRRKLLRAAAALAARPVPAEPAVAPAPAPIAAASPATTTDTSGRPAAAERRHLTVMFCDLVGSTALAARLDPEDVREVVRAYQGACAQAIGSYEGFVAQYLGDGIMAYFGYPQAHEDDAERAVRAGLDLVAAIAKLDTKTKIDARVGIATGLVVVGDLIGEHAAKERAVTGETPNLAARLQGLAAPGSIVVSAATRRLLGGMFVLRDLGAQPVKGLGAPAQAFAVEGVRSFESRFEARAGGLTGFVGREEEAEHLLARKKLAWQGRGQVVLVSGEAGIGKSRLSAWLVDKVLDEPHTRVRYQCTPHHKDSALYPTIAQLERAVGVEAGAPAEKKLDKLEAVLALAGLDTRAVAPLFAALLAISTGDRYSPLDMSPGQQRQRTLAAMLDQIEGLARQKPVLMVYEDAHWADATSLELMDMLVDRIARLPVLVIVTGRPEFAPVWAGRHNVTTLPLTRLDRRHARAIVESVSGAVLPAEVLDHIVAKTDGVPLFVEELTKTVLESGLLIEDGQSYRATGPLPVLAIPATLQDSLMARLDRSNPVKEIAQIGAAIGREFSYKLLLAVAGMDEASIKSALAKLEESELASRRGAPPDATYTFKHALVQDAAYESLLKSRRQTIHRRIAKALRDRFPVLAETEPEIIAHHFTQGGRVESAVEWWTKAGELAMRRSAYIEATSHFEKAITLADGLPGDPARGLARFRLQVAYGNALIAVHGYNAPEVIAAFARCAQLGVHVKDVIERFSGFYGIWVARHAAGEAFKARELAETFLREIGPLSDGAEAAIGHRILGSSRFWEGDYAGAIPQLESAVSNYDADRDLPLAFRFPTDVGVTAMIYLAFALWPTGHVDRARVMAERSMAHAIRIGYLQTLGFAHANKGVYEAILFNADNTFAHGHAAVALGRENDTPVWVAMGTALVGWARWRAGARKIGMDLMQEGWRLCRGLGHGAFEPLFAVHRAEALAELEPKTALSNLQELLDHTAGTGQRWFDAEIHRRRGEILVRHFPQRIEVAEEAFGHALAVSRAQQTRSFELRASLDLARLYRDTGREREARDLLGPALVGFTETPELPEIGEAQRLLASLS